MSLRSSIRAFGQNPRSAGGMVIVAAAVFLLVAGIGAATSYLGDAPKASSRSGSKDETLTRLENYTRSIATKEPASKAADGQLLPDVNTMIERLAARLEAKPDDVNGWRMLGWSYFNTGRYEQAAFAYAKAVALDPNSAEFKRSYEEAKAKASGANKPETASASQTDDAGKSGETPHADKMATSAEAPVHERDAAIRAMVDGLAHRLEGSPRDVDGWTRLMRSRIVLGEREVALTAFRKALDVFNDDKAASGQITAAANELGLKVE